MRVLPHIGPLLRGKVYVDSPDMAVYNFSGLYINYPQVLEFTLSQSHLPGERTAQFSAAVAIHTAPIFISPGTYYYWVDIGGVDSKLAHSQCCGNRTPDLYNLVPTP